ncbi:MAG TPA: efflux RND transporter periplasmic adaptor subunit [Thermodesulfobacteriota bacterium]|nr:efflux RND transporter periplasmic adaptor subunit [Thermodesulfobacteriota bacterium]
MKIKKTGFISASVIGCIILAIVFFMTRGEHSRVVAKNPPYENQGELDAHKKEVNEEKPKAVEKPEAGEEKSDLDRPTEELWAATCEHKIPQYTCDECRYEVGVVKLDDKIVADAAKPGIVKVVTVAQQSFTKALLLTGEVKVNELKTVRISTPVQGTVIKVQANTGQQVSAGEVLVELDSSDVAEAKGDYLKKAASVNLARKAAERETNLFAKKVSAEIEMLEAQAKLNEAEIDLKNATTRLERLGFSKKEILLLANDTVAKITGVLPVHAPINGTVLEKNVSAGERVEAEKEILTLSDLSTVWVWADIKEADLSAVQHAGEKIAGEVEIPGAEGKKYQGSLDVVSGQMEEQSRTVKARISVANPDGFLRPGMFVTIKLMLSGSSDAVAVPKVAVLADAGRTFVFVHQEGDYWIRRPVSLGETLNEYVEIKDGLSIGQRIIADGSFLLKSDVLRKKMGAGCAD